MPVIICYENLICIIPKEIPRKILITTHNHPSCTSQLKLLTSPPTTDSHHSLHATGDMGWPMDYQDIRAMFSEQADAKRQKSEQAACARASKAEERIRDACRKLLSGRCQGDGAKLAIADLITLIKWKGGTVPASTRKEDKNDLVIAWEAVQPPREEMEARAGRPAAPQRRRRKLRSRSGQGQSRTRATRKKTRR